MEHFALSREDDVLHVLGHVVPSGPAYPESITVVRLDEQGRMLEAHWRQRGTPVMEGNYVLEGNTLKAKGRSGSAEWEHAEITLPDDAVVTSPVMAAQGLVLRTLELAAGASREATLVSFGMSGWRPELAPGTIERLEDERLPADDGDVMKRIRVSLKTAAGNISTTYWIDDKHQVRQYAIDLGPGTLRGVAEFD